MGDKVIMWEFPDAAQRRAAVAWYGSLTQSPVTITMLAAGGVRPGAGITERTPAGRALPADGRWIMEHEEPANVEAGMRRCIEVVMAA